MPDFKPHHSGKQIVRSLIGRAFVLLISLIFFDSLIFKSCLYRAILSPSSMAGFIYYFDKFEKRRNVDQSKDVLVLGDSKVSEGFSSKGANELANGQIHFVSGGLPGSTYRSWYFVLKSIDSQQNRYKAVVLVLPSYRLIPGSEANLNQRMLDMDIVGPLLSSGLLYELGVSFPAMSDRIKIWSLIPFRYQLYKTDFKDLLSNPLARWHNVAWRNQIAEQYAVDYEGRPENMTGLAVDFGSGNVLFPDRLSPEERVTVLNRYLKPSSGFEKELDEYSRAWIGKILDYYRETGTKVFVTAMPTSPIPEFKSLPHSKFYEELIARQEKDELILLDENLFAGLEKPEYFFDTLHLNQKGRKEFTEIFTLEILKTLF